MSDKDDDAALLTQGKEEDAGRRKIDRKDGLVFKLNDYKSLNTKVPDETLAEQFSVARNLFHLELFLFSGLLPHLALHRHIGIVRQNFVGGIHGKRRRTVVHSGWPEGILVRVREQRGECCHHTRHGAVLGLLRPVSGTLVGLRGACGGRRDAWDIQHKVCCGGVSGPGFGVDTESETGGATTVPLPPEAVPEPPELCFITGLGGGAFFTVNVYVTVCPWYATVIFVVPASFPEIKHLPVEVVVSVATFSPCNPQRIARTDDAAGRKKI